MSRSVSDIFSFMQDICSSVEAKRIWFWFRKKQHLLTLCLKTDLLRSVDSFQLEIVGFCRGWTEFFRVLCYYSAWGGLKPTFRDYLSVPSWRVNEPLKMERLIVSKRRFQTTSRHLISKKTEEFSCQLTRKLVSHSNTALCRCECIE